jgi:transposase
VVASDEDTAVAVDVAPGSAHDGPLLKPILKQAAARLETIDEVVGDKAFDGEPQREACSQVGAKAIVPPRANRVDPEPFDKTVYVERNRIERLIGKLKEFRRIATRYEKLKVTFLGWLRLVLGFISLRAKVKKSQDSSNC